MGCRLVFRCSDPHRCKVHGAHRGVAVTCNQLFVICQYEVLLPYCAVLCCAGCLLLKRPQSSNTCLRCRMRALPSSRLHQQGMWQWTCRGWRQRRQVGLAAIAERPAQLKLIRQRFCRCACPDCVSQRKQVVFLCAVGLLISLL